jgi:TonB-linked SusC/RagA family outer membrane protein
LHHRITKNQIVKQKPVNMKRTKNAFKALGVLSLLLMFPLWGFAQSHIIKGNVVTDGEPVIGATVRVKGSTTGTVTDIDGNYTIKAESGSTLQFSYVGCKDQEVKIGNKSTINVTLFQDENQLNEVVVVGYGTMKRSDLTGAVASVGDEAITKSVPTSIDQVLQGRAAGVQVQANTGTPGGSSTIRIRGTNSLNATSQPIFVIDGVIIDSSAGDEGNANPLAAINPSDILSMDILKDASATAIYGSRASNGVIMITTKKGKAGDATITYDGYVGWQAMPKHLDVMNLQQYAEHNNAIADAQIKEGSSAYVRPDLLGEGTDWQDELFRHAMMTSHNLSLSGGNDKVTYAFSAGYLDQDGIALGSGYKRQTLRGSTDAQIKKWLKGGFSFSLADSKQTTLSNDWGIILTALRSQPTVAVRGADGSYDGPDDQWMPENPVAMAEITQNYNKKQNFRYNAYMEASILKGLTFKTELSADYNSNKYYYYMPDYKFGIKTSDTRTSRWTATTTKYWSWRNILTYNNTFGKHTVNAMFGQEMSHNHYETQLTSATGFPSNTATDPSAGSNDSSQPVGYQDNSSLFSYFGRAFYSFDDRYLATFTLRRDGSSNFAKDNRWGWFPSAALAWRVSSESFMKDVKWVNNMKLRLGWGTTGNQNVEQWSYMAMLNTYNTPWGVGVLNGNNANPELKWETTHSWNIGLDLSMLHDRLNFVFDWYYKKTDDLLMRLDLPAFLGAGAGSGYGVAANPWGNVGSLRNTGIEFTINSVNIQSKDFQWTSNLVFSLNRNKVLSLDMETGTLPRAFQVGSETATVTNTVVGEPIAQFWGYKVIGRFDKPEDFYYKDLQGNVKQVALPEGCSIGKNGTWLGDYRFADLNDDGVIDNNDQTFIGNPEPKFTFGFGNTFSYKGFDLSLQFTGSVGNKVLNYNRRQLEITGSTSNLLTSVLDYARVEMIDENGPDDFRNYYVANASETTMPRLYTDSYANNNQRVSDNFIEDGSYLRLQNLSFSYTLPKQWIQHLFLSNVKVYMNIQNLFTISKYKGYDPEVGSLWGDALKNGIDYNRYPTSRIFTFGANISF